jgi:hypothetical protein
MTQRERLLANARRFQKRGKVGDAIRLHMLASEVRTIRYAPVAVRD